MRSPTSSCTTALHLARRGARRSKPGDEVIVPAFTWVSTANVVEYHGRDAGLLRHRPRDLQPRLGGSRRPSRERTVGIVPVHLFGLCADMDADPRARPRARAVGGRGRRLRASAAGIAGVTPARSGTPARFSFHPRKSITTGEGGMMTTERRRSSAALARSLRDHGAARSDHERPRRRSAVPAADYPQLGFNYRMTDLQGGARAARRWHALAGHPRRRARRARALRRAAERPRVAADAAGARDYVHGYQAYVRLFAPEEPTQSNVDRLHERRNALMAALEREGIATRQGTHAAALQAYYAEKYWHRGRGVSERVDRRSADPGASRCTRRLRIDEQETVVDALRRALRWVTSCRPTADAPGRRGPRRDPALRLDQRPGSAPDERSFAYKWAKRSSYESDAMRRRRIGLARASVRLRLAQAMQRFFAERSGPCSTPAAAAGSARRSG